MLEFVILAVVLYVIYSAVFGRADRKDEKRWPYLMRQEKECLKIWKKHGRTGAKKVADVRVSREQAADMERKMADMQRKIDDLEREARYRY